MKKLSRFEQFLIVYCVAGAIGALFMADALRFYADKLLSFFI